MLIHYANVILEPPLRANEGRIGVNGSILTMMKQIWPQHYTPFAVHLQKISIHLCPNLFHYSQYTLITPIRPSFARKERSRITFAYVLTFKTVKR